MDIIEEWNIDEVAKTNNGAVEDVADLIKDRFDAAGEAIIHSHKAEEKEELFF